MAPLFPRTGKAVDSMQSTIRTYNKTDDPVLRFLLTSSNLCSVGFLWYDTLGWCGKADVLRGGKLVFPSDCLLDISQYPHRFDIVDM